MRLVLVEDEALVARRLARLLVEILGDRLEALDHAPSLEAARGLLADGRPIDALFLDLSLHGRSGFELLEHAVAGSFHTIVVSAHHDRALEAFEYGVLDFVPKPFDRARLEKTVDRLLGVREATAEERAMRRLAVRKAGCIELVDVDRVVSIHGAGDYAELRCDDGRRHLHDKTLDALEALLPERFARVHRSVLVDLARVEVLESEPGSRYFLRLRGGERLPVGRTRVAALRRRWR